LPLHFIYTFILGLQYQPPKPLPQYYVPRPKLLNRLTKAILDSGDDSVDVDVCLAGMSGSGKTTVVKALCYQKNILEYFLDGFLWIKLGQDPIIKLKNVYHQLTAQSFTGTPDLLVEKIKDLVTNHLQKLLVIIDDVWKLEDVMLYLEIFRCCKNIVITPTMDLHSHLPYRHYIVFDFTTAMIELSIKLLTMQVEGFENPTIELITQLKGLAEDVIYWPIALGIVHHHLLIYCNKQKLSPNNALQKVMQRILAATDEEDKVGARPIIEASLEFLKSEDILRLSQLVLTKGISTPRNLLPHFWNVTEQVAEDCIERLFSCGLVQYDEQLFLTETTYKVVPCVEVHAIVMQYLFSAASKMNYPAIDHV